MDLFSVDFTHNELAFVRQSLDLVTISGKDAKFLAGLQMRLENELAQIEQMKREVEQKKIEGLQQIVANEQTKQAGKKNS